MAEFVTVIKEAERMCHHYESCNYGCPFWPDADKGLHCLDFRQLFPEEFERRVMKWSAEHPKEGET